MKHVRRKLLKRKTKKTKPITESLNTYQGLNTPQQLPQHILDQIPSGASLRPSLASMRQIAAQKMATPFLPLPFNLTPQQQQVQNMRNNNDLKENAINQAKQDMINENERKRSLQKQEVDAKRENQLMKQSLDNEKQEFDQKQKLLDEKHKLSRQSKDLAFQKSLMEGDKAIREQRIKNEEQIALIEQAKYENQKLKEKIDTNELNTKFNQYKKQYADLDNQNKALTKTIEKFDSEEFANEYTQLIENVSVAKARNRILTTLREAQNKLIEEKILSMTEPTEQQITAQYEQMKTDIEGKQAALVEQIKNKQKVKEEMDKLENLRKYKQKLVLSTDDMSNETAELTKLKDSIGNIDPDVKAAINDKINAEIKRDIEREKVDAKRKEEEAQLEQYIAEEKQKILESQEHKTQRNYIASMLVVNEQLKQKTKNWNEAFKAQDEAYRAQMENEARRTALQAKLEGNDAVEVLRGQFSDDVSLSPTKSAVIHNQIAAQSQLANQEITESAAIIQRFTDLMGSEATEGRKLKAFINEKLGGGDFIGYLNGQNNETLKDILSEYNKFEYVE